MTTLKQTKFVKEYIENGGNATQAAQETYQPKNMHTAAVIGSENLRKPDIRQLIDQTCQDLQFTPKEALKEVISICKSSGKDKLKALSLYSSITGMEAPTKTENKNENIDITQAENEAITKIARESLKSAMN